MKHACVACQNRRWREGRRRTVSGYGQAGRQS